MAGRRTQHGHPSVSEANAIKVGHRLTDPSGEWGTITAMSTGEWIIISWDDDFDDTMVPWSDIVIEEA